jgi:RNA polymerase sigma-70 factor (ECF subfamily)
MEWVQYPRSVDSASSKPGDLVLPVTVAQPAAAAMAPIFHFPGPPPLLLEELWTLARAESLGITREEFGQVLASIGAKVNYGCPPELAPDLSQKAAFFRGLHLPELALAQACALGRDAAWEQFLHLYRAPLTQAAVAITGSATLGHDLADSLYAELYGLRQIDGHRRSPLVTYSGRGSLLGWLRTTLVQRFRDHHRRTHRETALDDIDGPAPAVPAAPVPTEATILADAVGRTLRNLAPEDRFLLAAYYLDRQTLLQIAHTLSVHEATISRRLKRLVAGLRIRLLRNLGSCGLSRAAAEEALGADPRDIEINLRSLLQTSQVAAFSDQGAPVPTTASD